MTAIDDSAPCACPICGTSNPSSYTTIKLTEIWKCTECGVGWWNFSHYDLDGFYEHDYYFSPEESSEVGYENYDALEPSQRATSRRRLARIRAAVPDGTSLLDVGCGLGHFLSEARDSGWDVTGFEISRFAADRVKNRLGIEMFHGDLDVVSGRFDVITAWDVFEHVADPLTFLASCTKLLKSSGKMVLSTGDFSSLAARLSGEGWHLFNLPEHLFFHTPKSVDFLARKSALRITNISRPAAYYPVSYLRERLRRKAHIHIPISLFDALVLPVNLFDIMEVWMEFPGDRSER